MPLASWRGKHLRRPRALVLGVASIVAVAIVSIIFPAVELSNDHFIYLAQAFLRGELHVDAIPTHNPDLVDWQGHRYVPFGPFPAVVLVPFLPLLQAGMSVVWVNHLVTLANAAMMWDVLGRVGVTGERRAWALLLFFGSTPYLAAQMVNYLAHIVATGLVILGIWLTLRGFQPFWAGLALGAAFLTRAPTAFALPFFAWAAWVHGNARAPTRLTRLSGLLVTLAAAVVISLVYNYVRFQNPFESGYGVAGLAEPVLEEARRYGLFNPVHIPKNLFMMLLQGPEPYPSADAPVLLFPYAVPSAWGMGMLFTSPALVYAYRANRRLPLVRACWAAVACVLVTVLLYYGVGRVQFGYRYALDFMPFLIILAALGFPSPVTKRVKWLVLGGIVVNIWGTLILLTTFHF